MGILVLLLLLGDPTTVTQHVYRDGESLRYFFEDTDNIYQAEKDERGIRPRSLVQVKELQIQLRIDVSKAADGTVGKKMSFTVDTKDQQGKDVQYLYVFDRTGS